MNHETRVIVRINGGLGNQLFCYAAARRLALANDVPLILDNQSGYRKDRFEREYLLQYFNIQSRLADAWESYNHPGGQIRRRITSKINHYLPFDYRRYYKEEAAHVFDQRLLDLRVNRTIYLTGYWQSVRYFSDVSDQIQEDLSFQNSHSAATIELALEISKVNSVCVHVRRFNEVDYSSSWHAPLAVGYYSKAIEHIVECVDAPVFFIFGDDMSWIRDNFKLRYPSVYVDINEDKGYEGAIDDLWLMSQCKFHIVSNSSFSWWGAWLATDDDSIVVAPKQIHLLDVNYYPTRWRKL